MNSLKQIGLGIQQYVNVHKAFPPGGVAQVDLQEHGFNWVLWILPFMEGAAEYGVLEKGLSDPKGGNLVLNWTIRANYSHKSMPWLTCPSSPLPAFNEYGDPWGWGLQPNPCRFQALDYSAVTGSYESNHRTYWNANPVMRKGFSGLMPQYYVQGGNSPHTGVQGGSKKGKYSVRLREVTDGLSKTLAVVETSGVLFENHGAVRPGRNTEMFLQGPCCADWQPTGHWGTTTISLPVGTNSADAFNAIGHAWPITSGHGPSGIVVMADGSVHHFHDDMDMRLLWALGDRNDDKVVDANDIP
jgi:hypothetical protein